MNKKVLIVSFSFEQEQEAFDVLIKAGLKPVLLAEKDRKGFDEEKLIGYIQSLDQRPSGIIMGADIELSEKFVQSYPELKYISLNCAGSDHLNLKAFENAGIQVCNVPRQNFDAVADLVWGLIISLMRNIVIGDKNIRAGKWVEGVARGRAVSKKTLGIIGFGAIGQAVAKRAIGFEMNVIASDPIKDYEVAKKYNVTYVENDELFKEADIIVPNCPLVPSTYHLINKNTISIMKDSAVIINASRGGVINTEDLIEALKNNVIAGAALDAFEKEPLYESELFNLNNVVLTPHMGGLADREIRNVAIKSAENAVILQKNGKTGSELF